MLQMYVTHIYVTNENNIAYLVSFIIIMISLILIITI